MISYSMQHTQGLTTKRPIASPDGSMINQQLYGEVIHMATWIQSHHHVIKQWETTLHHVAVLALKQFTQIPCHSWILLTDIHNYKWVQSSVQLQSGTYSQSLRWSRIIHRLASQAVAGKPSSKSKLEQKRRMNKISTLYRPETIHERTDLHEGVPRKDDHAEVVNEHDLPELHGLTILHEFWQAPHNQVDIGQADDSTGPERWHHEVVLHSRICGQYTRQLTIN